MSKKKRKLAHSDKVSFNWGGGTRRGKRKVRVGVKPGPGTIGKHYAIKDQEYREEGGRKLGPGDERREDSNISSEKHWKIGRYSIKSESNRTTAKGGRKRKKITVSKAGKYPLSPRGWKKPEKTVTIERKGKASKFITKGKIRRLKRRIARDESRSKRKRERDYDRAYDRRYR